MKVMTEEEAKVRMFADPNQFVHSYVCALKAIAELEDRLLSRNSRESEDV